MNFYRVTKYNPIYRKNGTYSRNEWTSISDVGKTFDGQTLHLKEYYEIENNYVQFCMDVVNYLKITKLQLTEFEAYTNNTLAAYKKISLQADMIPIFIKDCLREKCWGKLTSKYFFIHFGYDYYMYFGTILEKSVMQSFANKHNLFCEDFISPYYNQ